MANDVMPIGRFSPAPGIWVDRTDKSVKITGTMELYGGEATAARALSIQQSINTTWTQNFTDGYSVSCNVTVRYRASGSNASPNTAQIEALKPLLNGPSNVNIMPGMGKKMTLNANEADAFTWTPAHEFGHVIGLQDRYSESIMSKLKGTFGGTRTSTIDTGYEGNLMAVDGGALGSQNVADITKENEPNPYWMNDDDHIRDWVNAHSNADIANLSTTIKLRAIKTLMGGWISDADMSAIGKICGVVTTKAEADTIRNGVDLLDFTSIGQRTQMRVFFSQMPR